MSTSTTDFWTDDTSVLFTSYYGWRPDTWACVNWSDDKGRARRDNLVSELTDPFITVCYVTGNSTFFDPEVRGMIAGFFLVSHEAGDRDEFTHPIHHEFESTKWRHALRAIRAFSYLPEYRLNAVVFMPELSQGGLHVARWGEVITDRTQIDTLRKTPWIEVDIYKPSTELVKQESDPEGGFVKAGPASLDGYLVSEGTKHLERELYVLRLDGDTDAYLGRPAEDCCIYKIGLSCSPEIRRQTIQKSMPQGAFLWHVDRSSTTTGYDTCSSFEAAVTGEDAMKHYLAANSEWLGGEFYLATESQIEAAWKLGHDAVGAYVGNN